MDVAIIKFIISSYIHMATIRPNSSQSYFDGGILEFLGWTIIGAVLTSFTFGLMFPWMITKIYGWQVNHTVVEGKRLKFSGSALNLFGKWIVWMLICIVTLGIYGLWMSINLEKWKTENTSFA